jgi:outer membrane receptor protein involved in Fe transport
VVVTALPAGVALVLAAAAAVVTAPRPAHAADVADEAQFHFVRGSRFYRQERFDEALSEFYASMRLVPNRNVQFNIARCLERLRLYDEAFRAWSELLRASLPPPERAEIEASIEKLRPHLALLTVTSDPPGAEIYANRRDLGSLGVTPKRLALPPGQATVLLDLAGYRSVEVPVQLARGAEQKVSPALERIFGTLVFRALPPEAVVRAGTVDGPVVRVGPGSARLVPGNAVLFVSAPQFFPTRVAVDVAPDAETSVDVPLTPLPVPTGALVVRANLDGALVRVDGREMGFAPVVIEGVRAGERDVEVSHEERETTRMRVAVREGERTNLDVRLRPRAPEVSAATKSLVRAEDAPASITIITAEEIRAFGYRTVAEALAGIRGVTSSNDRTYEAVGFRGLSPPGDYTKRVLVLIDGHPYNDIVAGQGYVGHDIDVDLENVERIEVVRGPGSVLYGTGALFGVVNLVTRRPPPDVHAAAAGRMGTLGTTEGRITASSRGSGGKLGAAEVMVSAAGLDTTGDRKLAWQDGSTAALADGEQAKHADLLARVGALALRAGYNDRTKTIPTGVFATRPEPGTTYRDQRAWVELRYDRPLGAALLVARLAYDHGLFKGNYRQLPDPGGQPTPAYTADDFRAQWATGELRLELPVPGRHRLTFGAEIQNQFKVRQRTFNPVDGGGGATVDAFVSDTTELIASGYVVDDWTPSPRVRVNVGLRADDYARSFGWTLNPRLAVIAQPYKRGNTKLLLGRAFRAPSAYERFYNDGGATQIPGGALSPEIILNAELEHTHAVSDDLKLVVAGFAHQLDHFIVLDTTAPASDVFVFQNLRDPVRGYGAEAEVRWEPGGGRLLDFAYSWQRTRIDTAAGAEPLPGAPEHVASLRAVHPLLGSALRVGSEAVFDINRRTIDGEFAPNALIWNVTLSGEYRAMRLRYFAGVFNVLDDRSGYPVGAEVASGITVPRYGRQGRAGLAFTF